MEKTLIVGAGRFGYTISNRLSELGVDVVVIDKNEKRLALLKNLVSRVLLMNAVDREAFGAEVEGGGYDAGVVAIGDDFSSALLVALYMRQFGIPFIVARASNPRQQKIFSKIGVDLVVTPEDEMGNALAEKLILTDSEQIDLSADVSVIRVKTPKKFVGLTPPEIKSKEKGFHFLMVARPYLEQSFVKIVLPDESEFKINEGDYLLFVGDTRRIASFVESAK